jgi:hypothetical protein
MSSCYLICFDELLRVSLVSQPICMYSQTCVQRPDLGPQKSGRLTEVSDKTEI